MFNNFLSSLYIYQFDFENYMVVDGVIFSNIIRANAFVFIRYTYTKYMIIIWFRKEIKFNQIILKQITIQYLFEFADFLGLACSFMSNIHWNWIISRCFVLVYRTDVTINSKITEKIRNELVPLTSKYIHMCIKMHKMHRSLPHTTYC